MITDSTVNISKEEHFKFQPYVDIDNIPKSLQEHPYWCLWKYEERNGKRTKVPYNPHTGSKARPNDSQTFASFSAALDALDAGKYDGLGIGLFGEMCAVDIDHCINEDGIISDLAQDIIDTMCSYTELSPSGNGIRIIFTATQYYHDSNRYYINNQKMGLEIYVAGSTQKYVTITGNSILDEPIAECSEAISAVAEKYMLKSRNTRPSQTLSATAPSIDDNELITIASNAKNGDKFQRLMQGDISDYNSQSEADLGLCNFLAFYSNGDIDTIDRVFRSSGLYRAKWEREDYRTQTINKAVSDCNGFYKPENRKHQEKRCQVITEPTIEPNSPKMQFINPIGNAAALERYTFDERGNGYLFADTFQSVCRFCPEAKSWYFYDGQRWRADTGNVVARENAKELSSYLFDLISDIEDDGLRERYRKNANSLSNLGKRDTMLRDAQTVHPIYMRELNTSTYLFNCQNGTLNLNNMTFTPHSPKDNLSVVAGVQLCLAPYRSGG